MKFNSVTIPESLRGVVIKTKYLGATDYRGAKIKATHKRENDKTFTKTISKDYELEPAQNALRAANALIESWEYKEYHPNMKIVSMGWDNDHYIFVVV